MRYHLKDTNITEQTPAAATELEARLRATQIEAEQADQQVGGNFQTFAPIGGGWAGGYARAHTRSSSRSSE